MSENSVMVVVVVVAARILRSHIQSLPTCFVHAEVAETTLSPSSFCKEPPNMC